MMPSFALGDWKPDTYATLTALSYFLGAVLGAWLLRRDQRTWRDVADVLLVASFSALLGSKLFHVLFESRGHLLSDGREASGMIDLLRDDPWHWARIFDPGYVFYGGLLVATVVTWLFAKRQRLPRPGAIADALVPSIALGIVLGRLGCFLAGCCFGADAPGLPWAVVYPHPPLNAYGPMHPTQLYDATFGVLALGVIAWPGARRPEGWRFVCFLMAYSLWRFVTEFFRGDLERGVWLGFLSTSQALSLLVFGLSCLWIAGSGLDNRAQV